jgi:hypothetical protein
MVEPYGVAKCFNIVDKVLGDLRTPAVVTQKNTRHLPQFPCSFGVDTTRVVRRQAPGRDNYFALLDAVKIARIYLSGLSAVVWQPDAKTAERREVFSAYQGVVLT